MAVGEEFFRGVEPSGPTVTERWALTTSCTLRLRRLLLLVNEDPFFQTLRISEQNLYTFGLINHTRQFQMELQRTAEQVIEKRIFCNEPMGNVNQIAKTVASDDPSLNDTVYNGDVWIGLKVSRFSVILVRFRRLKQDPSDLRGCAGKLKIAQFVRLREVVSMMTNKVSGEEAREKPEEETLEIFRALGPAGIPNGAKHRREAMCVYMIIEIMTELKQYKPALKFAKNAFDRFVELDCLLGQVYIVLDKPDKAIEAVDQARAIADSMGDKRWSAENSANQSADSGLASRDSDIVSFVGADLWYYVVSEAGNKMQTVLGRHF
ncbi:unnamed protein product [Symbiodinium sp. KB8]|nr:unnamed protein product [Symbiodinium sp. KB8]